jgi:[phosphatase 2A protein]-leucine-carboxy methyltransferase
MRGINLKTLSSYPTLSTQIARFRDCGYVSGQDAIDINFAHDFWMGQSELKRISKLELLDELEEWRLLAAHYCISWGWINSEGQDNISGFFQSWSKMKEMDSPH